MDARLHGENTLEQRQARLPVGAHNNGGGQPLSVVRKVGTHHKRAHRMPKEHVGDVGKTLLHEQTQAVLILNKLLSARGRIIHAALGGVRRSGTMPKMIDGAHSNLMLTECACKGFIAHAVLHHAVCNLYHCLRGDKDVLLRWHPQLSATGGYPIR